MPIRWLSVSLDVGRGDSERLVGLFPSHVPVFVGSCSKPQACLVEQSLKTHSLVAVAFSCKNNRDTFSTKPITRGERLMFDGSISQHSESETSDSRINVVHFVTMPCSMDAAQGAANEFSHVADLKGSHQCSAT